MLLAAFLMLLGARLLRPTPLSPTVRAGTEPRRDDHEVSGATPYGRPSTS
ncbi:hypothetical protein V2I01_15995 [Micromonospora sp. BRA006-A]|nr:hypothetical protein [Micromonospora sp. BRA006-A]